jgi:hypothetical protein
LLEKAITVLDDTIIINTIEDQSQVSNVLMVDPGLTLTAGQAVTGFGIKPNSVIVSAVDGVVTLNNFTTYPVLYTTNLTVSTPRLKGMGEIDFLEADTVNLDTSEYTFSIKYLDQDGEYVPAYSNTYYGINGVIHLAADVYPVLQPSQTITSFLKTFSIGTNLYYYPSGNVYAYPEYNSNNPALHTVAMYMTNFRGVVTIQGTLSNQPDNAVSYADIGSKTYTGFSGVDYYNFNGVYTYIRIIYTPSIKPGESTNDNPSYFGSFDKVLYRS